MAVFLPSACQAFRNWQAFKTVRLFLDEGHSIQLSSSSSSVVSTACSPEGHPGRVSVGQDTTSPSSWRGHRAGCGFWRMYVNESTASVQLHVRDAVRNVPDLNKNRAVTGGDRQASRAVFCFTEEPQDVRRNKYTCSVAA